MVGLAQMAAISLLEEANSFNTPDWVIKDVTADLNYKNGYLDGLKTWVANKLIQKD